MTHNFDPYLLSFGPVHLSWYWFFYLVGFFLVLGVSTRLFRIHKNLISQKDFVDLFIFAWVGLILGGRLAYVLIYNYDFYALRPEEILKFWKGGMSFHGALVGGILSCATYAFIHKAPLLRFFDLVAIPLPLALALGRLGNFLNGELWGRPTDVPWAMVFPQAGPLPRHPSQLYEALAEGLLLFLILWLGRKKWIKMPGALTHLFIAGYALLRFFCEFFREPDSQLGVFVMGLSMGQILSLLFLFAAAISWFFLTKNPPYTTET